MAEKLLAQEALARGLDVDSLHRLAMLELTRLFARDATLWTGGDEGRWLGWLDVGRSGTPYDPPRAAGLRRARR